MKKYSVIIVFFILLNSLVLAIASPGEEIYREYSESVDTNVKYYINESIIMADPIFYYKNDFLSIELENSTMAYEIGKPMLPVITKCFVFPLGTLIVDVNVEYTTSQYELSTKIYPSQTPIFNGIYDQLNRDDMFVNKTVYSSDNYYPENPVTITKGAGLDNNEHVLFLTIRLASQYNPVEDIIFIPKIIDIEVCYSPPKQPLYVTDDYDMIIVTPGLFVDELQPLVDHKNTIGIRVLLVTTNEIYSNYDGRDNAERIKYFIKDAIEEFGIHYLLIVGDVELVPMRKSDVTVLTRATIWKGILTDLYYADIYDENGSFSSWDSNGDGVYGECRFDFRSGFGDIKIIDDADLYPDVGVGRLPCSDTNEVHIVVDKIIQYETETHGAPWFNKIILMGGDTFASRNDEYLEGEYFLEHYVGPQMENNGFEPVKLFTSLDTFNPDMINTEITSGAGFVSYAGHGNTYRIATFPPNDGNTRITYEIADIEGMNNNDKLAIFFLDACLTGKLDYNIFDKGILILYPFCLVKILLENIFHTKIFPCFAWSILKKSSGGGIGVIASSQPAMEGLYYNGTGLDILFGASLLHRYFFEAYQQGIMLSNMFIQSQNSYINKIVDLNGLMWDHNTINEFNLLGDPSLKIGGYS